MFWKKKELKILIPYEDSDTSTFNCVGIHKGAQFMAHVAGADPIDVKTGLPEFPNPNDLDWAKKKRWYGIIHLFDMDGNHKQTVAINGGTTAEGKQAACQRAFEGINEIVLKMESPKFCSIKIKPFRYEQGGYLFALVHEKNEESETATLWPNDIMFHMPWDGKYST